MNGGIWNLSKAKIKKKFLNELK